MGSGGKGGGSSYTPPAVPPLPVYQPPAPLPALPKDPAADYNEKKQAESIKTLQADAENAQKKASLGGKGPLIYTREEAKAVQQAGPFG